MDKSKNLVQKINFINNEKNNNQQNLMYKNESQNEKEEVNEIIIELEISNDKKEKEIYILCDKNQLIKDNKRNEDYYKKNNINPPKEFNYFNKDNTILYLNEDEIDFNYKINFNKKGTNKIIIKNFIYSFYYYYL